MRHAKHVILIALAAVMLGGLGCAPRQDAAVPPEVPAPVTAPAPTEPMPKRVSFTTEDGVTVVGHLYEGDAGGPSALLLHMMPATKESWRPFAEKLLERGFSTVLAIDLRGHGESTAKGGETLDFTQFTDAEQQAKIKDVEAAVAWMEKEKGVTKDRLLVAGASIGANLSIAYAASNAEVPAVVALSPGLDYRGVTTNDKVPKLGPAQRLFLAASKEDEYSYKSVRQLFALKSGAAAKELDGAGHGTTMFEKDADFMADVLAWVAKNVK